MRPSQTVKLRDGRILGWADYGDRSGRPVLAFHGAPACRVMFAVADTAARRLDLRIIAPDRPGYGLSDPLRGRSLGDWAGDVAQLMDHLAIGRAAVLAISGGGPYAIATAAQLGPRIRGLALVSPLGETAEAGAAAKLSRAEHAFFVGLPRHPALLRCGAAMGRMAFTRAPNLAFSAFRSMLATADRSVLATAAAREIVIDMTREALRAGIEGAVSDMAIYGQTWGVDIGAIDCPSVLWQGTADTIVPVELAFELGRRLANCSVRRLEGQGHFWVLEHIEDVLLVVGQMAGPEH